MVTDGSYLETHRFSLNEISRPLLRELRKVFKDFRRNHPEVIATVEYGSQVTGQANKESDADSVVFVDVDTAGLIDNPEARLSDTEGDPNWETINKEIGIPYREAVISRLNLKEKDKRGIKLRLISIARVEKELEDAITYRKESQAKEIAGEYRSGAEIPKTSLDLLFHLQIGGNALNKYRNIVLNRLKAEGEIGDRVWRDHIVFGVQFRENGRLRGIDRTSNDLFPSTIAKAVEKFQVNN